MIEKARQGHWPTVAPVGYVNNLVTHRIEPDPDARRSSSSSSSGTPRAILAEGSDAERPQIGLTNRTGGAAGKPRFTSCCRIRSTTASSTGWGNCTRGFTSRSSRETCLRPRAGRVRSSQPSSPNEAAARLRRARDLRPVRLRVHGEMKKGQHVYYHCTGPPWSVRQHVRPRGGAGSPVRRAPEAGPHPTELAGKLATVLRESQADKEKFVRTSMLRLQQQQMLLRSKLDRVYEDRLSDAIPEELWTRSQRSCRRNFGKCEPRWSVTRSRAEACETRGAPDSRTRANRLFLVCCEKSARTGASCENAGIELHVRSRKSFSHLR